MSKAKVKPIEDNVLVEPAREEKTTKSGIVIPDTAGKEKPQMGKVIAVGGSKKIKGLKKGDKVVYSKYSGDEIKIDNKEYLMIKYENILAVIE